MSVWISEISNARQEVRTGIVKIEQRKTENRKMVGRC
jgi:hypothetical protein